MTSNGEVLQVLFLKFRQQKVIKKNDVNIFNMLRLKTWYLQLERLI